MGLWKKKLLGFEIGISCPWGTYLNSLCGGWSLPLPKPALSPQLPSFYQCLGLSPGLDIWVKVLHLLPLSSSVQNEPRPIILFHLEELSNLPPSPFLLPSLFPSPFLLPSLFSSLQRGLQFWNCFRLQFLPLQLFPYCFQLTLPQMLLNHFPQRA